MAGANPPRVGSATGTGVAPAPAAGTLTGICCSRVCGELLGTGTGVGGTRRVGAETAPPPHAAMAAAAANASAARMVRHIRDRRRDGAPSRTSHSIASRGLALVTGTRPVWYGP